MNNEPNPKKSSSTSDPSELLGNMPSYEKHMVDYRKTFGEGVSEVFDQEKEQNDFINGWEEYKNRARMERELLETLDSEKRKFQDYIFSKTIQDNPNGSDFIKKTIPDFNANKPITPQLLAKNNDGTYKLPDETIGNIMEFYNQAIGKEKDKFLGEAEELQSNYESNLRERVQTGVLPKALLDNYEFKKQQNAGLIFDGASLFDMRPEDESGPAGVAAYVEHRGINDAGETTDFRDMRKILYKKAFISPEQIDQLGSVEIALSHELTHIIAGTEASFNLMKDGPEKITEAYREGMTEAIGQMLADGDPEASQRGLQYYLDNETGAYRAERKFLSRLINIDNRLLQETDYTEEVTLESLCLDAYADAGRCELIDALRQRLLNIFENWENIVQDEDFPDCDSFELSRGGIRGWQSVFELALMEMEQKYMIEFLKKHDEA